ncbi:hypothetical protein Cgig2_006749 [Carnegiea gigantea]|uniref:Uncharacterized protein n=1 Tax=Carnegiea gigantea TaxID=171969 RepID=A0A9Q1GWW0_9CARY|nr:hypothetical protein Cgig2_006749 [Carnegiea gigantea]
MAEMKLGIFGLCGPPWQLCNSSLASYDPFGIFYSLLSSILFYIHDANIFDSYFLSRLLYWNVRVSREGEEATYVDVPLVLELECPELPFPPTFTRYNCQKSGPIVAHFCSIRKAFVNLFACHHPQIDEITLFVVSKKVDRPKITENLTWVKVVHPYALYPIAIPGLAGTSLDNSSSINMPTFLNATKFSNVVNYRSLNVIGRSVLHDTDPTYLQDWRKLSPDPDLGT